jgi:hypothetical protein
MEGLAYMWALTSLVRKPTIAGHTMRGLDSRLPTYTASGRPWLEARIRGHADAWEYGV